MKELKQFNIPYVGLKEGTHLFEYQVDNTFFEAFQFDEFNDANVKVTIDFVKKSTLLELDFTAKGTVTVPCDVTSELFDQEINDTLRLLVKFGPEFNDDNEDILVLPHEEYQLNVAQYIYELIVLAVPNKRVHPKVVDGTMESDVLKKLHELELTKEKSVDDANNDTTDPRWDKLKDLLTGKNT